jgi:hypothetical protein
MLIDVKKICVMHKLFDRLNKKGIFSMELFALLFAFLLVLLYKLLNKIVPDDDKNKDKRDDIERWNDHLNYRG